MIQEMCEADFGEGNIHTSGIVCAIFHFSSVGGLLLSCVHKNLLLGIQREVIL